MLTQNKYRSMAGLIKKYIQDRRNSKEFILLKNKPNKKQRGGINKKLFEIITKGLPKEKIKDLEKQINDEIKLFTEQKRYEIQVAFAEENNVSIEPIIDEYQEYLQSSCDGQGDNILKYLKNKPDKKGKGGINQKLFETITNGLSSSEIENLEKAIKNELALFGEQKKYEILVTKAKEKKTSVQPITDEYLKQLQQIKEEHDVNSWLSQRAKKAHGVSLSTHVIKLTHSGISGASCFYDKGKVQNNSHLTTAHIPKPIIDGAYLNAADAPIVTLLQLKLKDETLADQIFCDDNSGFVPFAQNKAQLNEWMAGFRRALDNPYKSSHYMAKQVYFPVEDNKYHLLSIVPASSLCHELFERFQDYWSEAQKEARDCKRNKKYSSNLCVRYPNKAVLKVTATNPQNVSILNGKRTGQWPLLCCQPPVWKNITKPPLNKRSLFQGEVHYRSLESSKKLQRLLLTIKNKELSASNPKIHARLSGLVEDIINTVFNYVTSIHNLEDEAGWSRDAKKLKQSHQLWLDPFRDDEEFQQLRKSVDWQADICRDFSLWLNKRLEHKKLTLGKVQEAFWQKVFKPRLREFNAVMEVKR